LKVLIVGLVAVTVPLSDERNLSTNPNNFVPLKLIKKGFGFRVWALWLLGGWGVRLGRSMLHSYMVFLPISNRIKRRAYPRVTASFYFFLPT
jgi:hypothetical protein